MKKVPTDNSFAVRGDMLKKMVEEDKAAGLIPFYVRKDKARPSNHHRADARRQTQTATPVTLDTVHFYIELQESVTGLLL